MILVDCPYGKIQKLTLFLSSRPKSLFLKLIISPLAGITVLLYKTYIYLPTCGGTMLGHIIGETSKVETAKKMERM